MSNGISLYVSAMVFLHYMPEIQLLFFFQRDKNKIYLTNLHKNHVYLFKICVICGVNNDAFVVNANSNNIWIFLLSLIKIKM